MLFRISILLTLIVTTAHAFETKATLSGIGTVIDGDGVLFGQVEVRLQGIAAPEDNSRNTQPGGPESTSNLRQLVNGKYVVCHLDGTVAGKRPVGVCFVDGVEINRYQVETGHARDCPAFSRGRYRDAETTAREAGSDISKIYDLPSYCLR